MRDPRPLRPRWEVPSPYGYAAAIDGMGSIAAPLLAATSVALVGLVLTLGSSIRWSNVAMLLLVGSSFGFVGSVQLTFWAKRFVVTPADLADWWPDPDEARQAELEWEQRYSQARFVTWANRSRWAYNVGILCLLGALPVMLVPRDHASSINEVRLAVIALAAGAFIVEATWIGLVMMRPEVFDRVDRVD